MRDLPRGTQVADPEVGSLSPTGLSPSLARLSMAGSANDRLCNSAGTLQGPDVGSYNPRIQKRLPPITLELVWAIPVSLATTQGMISFPPATEMFQFAGLTSPGPM